MYVTIFPLRIWVIIMGESAMKKNEFQRNQVGSVVSSSILENELRPYEKPLLVSYGDVRDVTLGPTLGGGESGNADTRCDRGNIPPNCIT